MLCDHEGLHLNLIELLEEDLALDKGLAVRLACVEQGELAVLLLLTSLEDFAELEIGIREARRH